MSSFLVDLTDNFAMFVGEYREILDSILDANGAPQDIENWSSVLTIHAPGDPDTVYLTKAGVILGASTDGQFLFTFDPADTSFLLPGQYAFKVERTNSGFPAVPTIGLATFLAR